ncbi:conserved Plasmodium membrane protein, unknown function [Plasmodium gallinaceum]|uniref:Uncharacterized protein n=1 Tax=Plasmodium gallinaceum TaxID=5849 RepID=A0A1J1GM70_PLAGA|nr:conserved Plasmodium membrane protein, unknown function [Plasmodium gallinaceum]CRG93333.1 conserved Plasmodium membrane protein, unknown function [Plasmodium gallinaceum]
MMNIYLKKYVIFFVVIYLFKIIYCFDENEKLIKLKKLINKKIKLHLNETYGNLDENKKHLFIYIHEITLNDYIDYVLNKTDDYDCVLFYIDVESNNTISKFDRKSLVLLELYNEVAKKIILDNNYLYNENNFSNEQEKEKDKQKNYLIKPVFFFYINFNKYYIKPLKYVHTIYNLPEFIYINSNTFDNFNYSSRIKKNYMLEHYIKNIKQIGENKKEINNKIIQKYFIEFINLHNRNKLILHEDLVYKKKLYITVFIILVFIFLYFFVLLLQKYTVLIFICSFILYLICLSGIFHCLINKSEMYNTDKSIETIFQKYIYRSTNSQYILEGFVFSFLIFVISILLFTLLYYSNNENISKIKKNFFFLFLILIIYISFKIIDIINIYKIYYSTYFFFPPLKFFRK